MRLFWLLFLLAWPVAAVVFLAVAPSMDWWFPTTKPPGEIGAEIDHLFYVIGGITGVIFLVTFAALGIAVWRGSAVPDGQKALYVHGNHRLEVAWTLVPLGILVFIAVYQTNVWAGLKIQSAFPEGMQPIAEVQARQFEWRIRYPGLDPETGRPLPLQPQPQATDVWTVNDLHVPAGQPVLIRLKSQDIQHSFYLPELRIKQDAVPGLNIPVWFETAEPGEHVLMCAELCGWGHTKMNARLVAEDGDDAWLAWMQRLQAEQRNDGVPTAESVVDHERVPPSAEGAGIGDQGTGT